MSSASILTNNPIIRDAMHEMMCAQPAKDRATYIESVCEATLTNGTKSQLIQKLYKDITDHSGIDFGKIPDSRGDLSRYYYYPQMSDCINILNNLYEASANENVALMNRLNDAILALRGDFEFGFKMDVELIKLYYNILVMGLYETINVCICDVANELKQNFELSSLPKNKTDARNRLIMNYVRSFLKIYDNGDWAKMMHQFRADGSNFLGFDAAKSYFASHPEAAKQATQAAKKAAETTKHITKHITAVGKPVLVIGSIIVALVALRFFVYYFYSTKQRLSNWAAAQSALIRANLSSENVKNGEAQQKQIAIANKLDATASTLNAKIRQTEEAAMKALHESNKDEYSREEMTSTQFDLNFA